MANTARLYKIESLIRQRGHIGMQALLDELEVSRATLKRDLEYLRSRLNAPIEYDPALNGYRFGEGVRGQSHELPGLWFNERELYSLLMAHQLLSELDQEAMLSRHLQPLLSRIHQMLGGGDAPSSKDLIQRIKIISALRRPVPGEFFELVSDALLTRRRLHMRYLTRARREVSEREVSPQRLVHYRNTWYLDAWCHRANGLRRFALDAIEQASLVTTTALDLPMSQVQSEMDAGYGIFAGGQRRLAVLLFSPKAAPWISREEWHPEQRGRWVADGSYELTVPYVDDTELMMDVLRQAEQVQVLEPASLRLAVEARLEAALAQSRCMDTGASR